MIITFTSGTVHSTTDFVHLLLSYLVIFKPLHCHFLLEEFRPFSFAPRARDLTGK
jgi:hypothetical protein